MIRRMLYILDENRNPVPAPDLQAWIHWRWIEEQKPDRGLMRVRLDMGDGWSVSTVFLGVDASLLNPPAPFETMVSTSEDNDFRRYRTWAEAEAGHAEAVARLRSPPPPSPRPPSSDGRE